MMETNNDLSTGFRSVLRRANVALVAAFICLSVTAIAYFASTSGVKPSDLQEYAKKVQYDSLQRAYTTAIEIHNQQLAALQARDTFILDRLDAQYLNLKNIKISYEKARRNVTAMSVDEQVSFLSKWLSEGGSN